MAKYKIIPSSRTIVQSPISIGHKAEKGVQAIEFDLTAWVETYGSGTLTVIMRRWEDAIPYPIALEIDENNKATWTLSDIDTAKAGMAYAQLSYVVGDEVVKKSDIYTFRVMDSLTGEGEPPEAYESWLEHLTHLAAEAMAEVLDIEGIVTDKTLTVDGGIADAKAAGDALALKADKSTTYTKNEVDQMIEDVEIETDTTLEIPGAPADAKKVGDELSDIKADLDDVNESLGDVQDDTSELGDKVTALEFNGGITPTVKNALLACFANVAWKDEDSGPDRYQDLEDALYPTTTLQSITAVYTQSSGVYVDTPLDDLKSDLVVTAHYNNGTTSVVPASYYTLTGILAVGTSTVSVSYAGKSTTFSVTVTAALYPFENGTHNFTNPASQITVSNGNTAVITASTANSNDTHANISKLSDNTNACNSTSNFAASEPYFTIPAGSTLSSKVTVTSVSSAVNSAFAVMAFMDMSGTSALKVLPNPTLVSLTVGQEFTGSVTVESATDIACAYMFLGRNRSSGACSIGLKIEAYLDGVRII